MLLILPESIANLYTKEKKHMKRVAMIKKALYIKVWCSYAMTDNFACTFFDEKKKIFTVAQSGMILCV